MSSSSPLPLSATALYAESLWQDGKSCEGVSDKRFLTGAGAFEKSTLRDSPHTLSILMTKIPQHDVGWTHELLIRSVT
jgi:hypothetical protein